MIRASGIFRSVTFWSGLLVMVFICWAWRDSVKTSTSGSWCYDPSGIYFDNRCSAVDLVWLERGLYNGGFRTFRRPTSGGLSEDDEDPFERDRSDLFPSLLYKAQLLGGDVKPRKTVALPHWLILLAFALPWSGLLLWRARRRGSFRMP